MQSTLAPLRPRTSGRFASLMELYERNYMLVRLIAPGLREMGEGEHVSVSGGSMPLVLDRVEHGRYTSTFNLTYRFSSRHRHAREPDLSIRLYHDARTCEVMSGLLPGGSRTPRRTRDLDEGWRLNRFLHRWLAYCLRQGHGFERAGDAGSSPSGSPSFGAPPPGARADAGAPARGSRGGSRAADRERRRAPDGLDGADAAVPPPADAIAGREDGPPGRDARRRHR